MLMILIESHDYMICTVWHSANFLSYSSFLVILRVLSFRNSFWHLFNISRLNVITFDLLDDTSPSLDIEIYHTKENISNCRIYKSIINNLIKSYIL